MALLFDTGFTDAVKRLFSDRNARMDNEDIVSSIMANLRVLHPELPERACVNLELDLRSIVSALTINVEKNETQPRSATATRRTPTPRTDISPRSEREPLGFADLRKGFDQRS